MDRPLDLGREAIAAREVSEAVRASQGYEEGDEQLAIASETNLLEELERAVSRLAELEALQTALEAARKAQAARLMRFAEAHERIRRKIKEAFETAGLPSRLELPSATITLGKGRPKVHVHELLRVPAQFLRFPAPEPNREAIALEWRDGREVPGTSMSNAEPTLFIKRS